MAMVAPKNGEKDHHALMTLEVDFLKIFPSNDLSPIFLKSGGQQRPHLLQANPCSPPEMFFLSPHTRTPVGSSANESTVGIGTGSENS